MLDLSKLKNTTTYPRARRVMERYKKYVVQQSRSNLTKGNTNGTHNASSKLYQSIKGNVSSKMNRGLKGRFSGGSTMPSLEFTMAHYGKFLDEGVKGNKSNYLENRFTKNKFKSSTKSVPLGDIRKWLKRKGLSEKLAFVIGRSIVQKGIKATRFFTKPLEKRNAIYMRSYHKAIADDIANNFANQIAKKLKKAQTNKLKKK